MTLDEIYIETAKRGAVRLHGCRALCLALLMSQGLTGPDEKADIKELLAHFAATQDWLNRDLPAKLTEMGIAQDPIFEEHRATTIKVLAAVMDHLKVIVKNLNDPDVNAQIKEVLDIQIDQLDPSYQAVLDGLELMQNQTDDKTQTAKRKVIDSALGELEMINSTINLIAVNASIEAARVGEYGLGFAVISTEIQQLSRKSRGVVDGIKASLA